MHYHPSTQYGSGKIRKAFSGVHASLADKDPARRDNQQLEAVFKTHRNKLCRSINDLDLSYPRWFRSPSGLVQMAVQTSARQPIHARPATGAAN